MIFIKYFVAIIWSVIGLIIWLPVGFRVMCNYIINIIYFTIMQKQIEYRNQAEILTKVGHLYLYGFEVIFNIGNENIMESPSNRKKTDHLWLEVGFAILFWCSLILPFFL